MIRQIFQFTGMLLWLIALGAGGLLCAGGLVHAVKMFIMEGFRPE